MTELVKYFEKNTQGRDLVVVGHTPHKEVQIRGNVICIDTGAVFGGKITLFQIN